MSVGLTMSNTLGIYLLATFAAAVLFGITNLQVFLYYRLYPNDSAYLKYAVAFLWSVDALILAFGFHVQYHYLILNFGNLLAIVHPVWSIRAAGVITCILLPFVQSLYALRVWKLYRLQKLVPILITVCVTFRWAVALDAAQKIYGQESNTFSRDFTITLSATWITAVVVDIATSAALCWHLYKQNRQFSCTDSMIRDIILWILGTGILTCAFSVVVLVTFLTLPETLAWIAVSAVQPKIAINGFLAMLNVRQSLRSTAAGNAFVLPEVQRANKNTAQMPLPVQIPRHACSDVIEISATKAQAVSASDDAPTFLL